MNNKKAKISFLMACLLLAMCFIPQTVYAYGKIDISQETEFTIEYVCPDTVFHVFRVADVSETAEFTLAGDFAEYPMSLEEMDSDKWRETAETLAAYAERDGLAPTAEGVTDAKGKLTVTDLSTGLYLVTGEAKEYGGKVYRPTPFLLALPNLTAEDTWDYKPVVSPKFDQEVPEEQLISMQVVKIWKGDGAGSSRPKQIVVQLLKDGVVYDEQQLDASNGWQYIWEGLDADAKWQITEKEVPSGYTVRVNREGTHIVITNTRKTPETPEKPEKPTELPQTGQLWWPVLVLTGTGLLLVILGIISKNRGQKN